MLIQHGYRPVRRQTGVTRLAKVVGPAIPMHTVPEPHARAMIHSAVDNLIRHMSAMATPYETAPSRLPDALATH